jgi:hypothetical protein
MDTDQKLINAVNALLDVVDEAVDTSKISESTQDRLESARRQMQGAMSQSDQDALA